MLLRFISFFVFLNLAILSCTHPYKTEEKRTFTSFDFTYSCAVCLSFYSIKFTQSDTIFLKQYLPRRDNKLYYAVLKKSESKKLDSLLSHVNLGKIDSSYNNLDIDGDEYQFYINKDTIAKSVSIHGRDIPKELSDLGIWLKGMKDGLKLSPIDTVINFESFKKYGNLRF